MSDADTLNGLAADCLSSGILALVLGAYCGHGKIVLTSELLDQPVHVCDDTECRKATYEYEYASDTLLIDFLQRPLEHRQCSACCLSNKNPQWLRRFTYRNPRTNGSSALPITHASVTLNGYGELVRMDATVAVEDSTETWTDAVTNTYKAALKALREDMACLRYPVSRFQVTSHQDIGLLREWNIQHKTTKSSYSWIPHLIKAQVALNGTGAAVCDWNGTMSYRDLDHFSDQFAGFLSSLGLGPGKTLVCMYPKSRWVVVAMIATLKLGATWAPLDLSTSRDRLIQVLDLIDAKWMICPSGTSLPARITQIPEIEQLLKSDNTWESTSVEPLPSLNATLFFTSGSTGRPKGIVHDHAAICRGIAEAIAAFGMHAGTRCLQFASHIFDVTVSEILASLCSGGCVCVPSEDERLNSLPEMMNNLDVNFAFLTPRIVSNFEPEQLPRLKTLVVGGEAPSDILIQTWTPHLKLYVAWGCTESGLWDTATIAAERKGHHLNVGQSIGPQVWITHLETLDTLMPIGAVGEIVIAGPSLGRDLEDLATVSRYFKNPSWASAFGLEHDTRFLRTGDVGFLDIDGSLRLLGRKDSQIKLRGYRIDMDDIEHHLSQAWPDEVAILAVPPRTRGASKSLVAVLARKGRNESLLKDTNGTKAPHQETDVMLSRVEDSVKTAIMGRLSAVLPWYMVPTVFVEAAVMPLSVTGKTDRKSLRESLSSLTDIEYRSIIGVEGTITDPQTPDEQVMRSLWATTIGVDEDAIGINNNFFQLGGDSITAMKLVTAARKVNWAIKVADIFRYPVLADLVTHTEMVDAFPSTHIAPFTLVSDISTQQIILDEVSAMCTVSKEDVLDVYPCSSLQEGLMYLSIKQTGTYVSRNVYKLPNNIDLQRFRYAWEQTVMAHAILRTRIVQLKNGVSVQVVLKDILDWKTHADLEQYLDQDRASTMGLSEPLSRYALVLDSQKQFFFVWTLHHALYDGWSMALILQEVAARYLQQAIQPSPAFAQFIKHLVESDSGPAQDFWTSYLDGSAASVFPAHHLLGTDNARADSSMTRNVDWNWTPPTGITVSTVIRTVWAVLVGQYCSSSSAVFGMTLSGRNVPIEGIEKVTGPTMSTVPIHVRLPSDMKFSQLLEKVQQEGIDMMPYEQTGLQTIIGYGSNTAAACQFSNLLLIQPLVEDWDCSEKVFGAVQEQFADANHDTYALTIECQLIRGGIVVSAKFDSRTVDQTQMQRILNHFEHLLLALPDQHLHTELGSMTLPNTSDRTEIDTWNMQPLETISRFVDELIHLRSLDQPFTQAICSWDGDLTYAELDEMSTNLAMYLINLGVGPDMIVPLCFEKSKWTVIAALGVLKAGGAYVHLDPAYPLGRCSTIFDDTSATILLTSTRLEQLWASFQLVTVVPETIMSSDGKRITENTNLSPPSSRSTEDLAMVVFTSGSTGNPKGILISHRSLASSLIAHAAASNYTTSSRVLQFASHIFDQSNSDIFGTLLFGGTICIPSDYDRMNNLSDYIRNLGVNQACLTPTVARTLNPLAIPSLKSLALGGEPIETPDVENWQAISLSSFYAPAECTITCVINSTLGACRNASNLGRGVGCLCWIVHPDDHNILLPIGAEGELLIEGPTLARGYLKDNQNTTKSFIKDPAWTGSKRDSSLTSGRRFYKTGDLVRYSSDGSILYIGRKDTQVKLHGQRVELGEIEHRLRKALPDKTVAVEVALFSNRRGHKTVTAFIAPPAQKSSQKPGIVGLNMHFLDKKGDFYQSWTDLQKTTILELSKTLPEHMIPGLFVPMERIPLTASGKIDRRKMKGMVEQLPTEQLNALFGTASEKIMPRNNHERSMRSIWCKTLEIPESSIGINDHFIRLGGDSVSAMKLVAAGRQIDMTFTVADVFQHPILSDLAAVAGEQQEMISKHFEPFALLPAEVALDSVLSEVGTQCSIRQDKIQDIYPCSGLQEGLMSLSVKQEGTYISRQVFRLPIDIDLERFRLAWETIFCRNGILRTRIVPLSGAGSVQAVLEENIEWIYPKHKDIESYLQEDRAFLMSPGVSLCRFALIPGPQQRCAWHFILTLHHAVYDGWSLPLILNEVTDCYYGNKLPRPVAFSRFIGHLTTTDETAVKSFWTHYLEGSSPSLFPIHQPGMEQPRADSTIEHYMDWAWKSTTGITAPSVIRTAWAMLISHYCSSNDVVFGMTLSGRNAPIVDIEGMTGPTITTVPIRIKLTRETRLDDLFQTVQKQTTEMIPYEQTGLSKIMGYGSDIAAACVFSNLLLIQPLEEADDRIEQKLFGQLEEQYSDADFDAYALTLECKMMHSGVRVTASFDSSVVQAHQMRRILNHFEHILTVLASEQHVNADVQTVTCITAKDREEIETWNSNIVDISESCVHELISKRTQEQPFAQAICSWDGDMTYAELDSASSRLAEQLIKCGVGSDPKHQAMVPLCFEKSRWAIVAMLGVLKAGGAFVPMDTSFPLDRKSGILKQVGAKIMLCSGSSKTALPDPAASQCDILIVDDDLIQTADETRTNGDHKHSCCMVYPDPGLAMYVIFTSGSTGVPKGAVIEHRSFASCAPAVAAASFLKPGSRALQFSSYSFDTSIEETMTVLLAGACICIPSDSERLDDLAGAINRMQVSWAQLGPTVAGTLDPDSVPTLRQLVLGGESCSAFNVKRWTRSCLVLNSYGVSECSVTSVVSVLNDLDGQASIIGRGVGCRCWVVNSEDHNILLPIGGEGELLIEGPGLARCYLNDEQKTSVSFVEDPQWVKPGSCRRFYKTGDLVRYNSDGSLSYIARKDTQVKLRGQRMEIGEIELRLRQILRNHEVTVDLVSLQHLDNEKALAAFVVFPDHSPETLINEGLLVAAGLIDTTLSKLRSTTVQKLSAILPQFMIPAMFVPVSHIPLTVSGKTDRRKLKSIVQPLSVDDLRRLFGTATTTIKQAPRTIKEKHLRALWSTVLKLPEGSICTTDNFVRLGGDSISAMKLVAAARRAGLSFSVVDVFKHAVLSDLAICARHKDQAQQYEEALVPFSLLPVEPTMAVENMLADVATQCNIQQKLIEDVYPCSMLQEGLMSLSAKHDWNAYVYRQVFHLPTNIDLDRFRSAWQKTCIAHGILRTRILPLEMGTNVQVVINQATTWKYGHDLNTYIAEDRKETMEFGKPLCRFALVEGPRQRYFVWTLHHAIYDGWSIDALLHETALVYLNQRVGKPTAFAGFIQYLTRMNIETAKDFWTGYLDGASASAFPPLQDAERPQSDSVMQCLIHWASEPTGGITVPTVLRTAWAMLIGQYCCSSDVTFGVVLSGRNAPVPGIDQITGPTITTVPVRVRLEPNIRVADLLQKIQEQAFDMVPFEQTGLQQISKSSAHAQAACTFSNLLLIHPLGTGEDDEIVQQVIGTRQHQDGDDGFDTHALTLECQIVAGGINVTAHYASKAIEHRQMKRILAEFQYILEQVSRQDLLDGVLSSIQMLNAQDRTQIEIWNAVEPETVEKCVHDLVSERTLQQPTSLAICAWDGQMTYAELEQASSILANYLIHLGVGAEIMVPLCFEKSKWTIVAMLGVLKAGGAYVPIDPGYPSNRCSDIFKATSASILLTSASTQAKWSNFPHLTVVLPEQVCCQESIALGNIVQEAIALGRTVHEPSPSHTAIVVFTSGSTGQPKGITLSHTALSSSLLAHAVQMGYTHTSRVLQFASYVFDVSNSDIFSTLIFGGTIFVPSEHDRLNNLAVYIQRHNINQACLTSSVASFLDPSTVPSLQILALGGEAVHKRDVTSWQSLALTNVYGPAECAIWCVLNTSLATCPDQPSNIGRGVGCRTWIVHPDNHNMLLPIGAEGELVIEGPGLARGYLNDEVKTAAAFITKPDWIQENGSLRRFYKTGDVVRYAPDGSLLYIGRKDTQVKLRGQRIELGEVEHHLRQVLQGYEVAVDIITISSQGEQKVLAAFIEISEATDTVSIVTGTRNANTQLISFSKEAICAIKKLRPVIVREMSKLLPQSMVPTLFTPMLRMPLTLSGKLDSRQMRSAVERLSANELDLLSGVEEKQPPRTAKESSMRQLWSAVLHAEEANISINDHFVRSGGDSIAAMRLVAAGRQVRLSFTVATIFKYPILFELAEHAEWMEESTPVQFEPFALFATENSSSLEVSLHDLATHCEVPQHRIEDVYPSSALQEGLMSLSLKRKHTFISRQVYRLPPDVDLARFRLAWEQIVHKHTIFRTRIVPLPNGRPMQVVIKESVDWQHSTDLESYLSRNRTEVMGFGQPLSRYCIVHDTATRQVSFVWTVHHALYDAWTIPIILRDVVSVYRGHSLAAPAPYTGFISYLKGVDMNAARSFWVTYLDECTASTFPFPEQHLPGTDSNVDNMIKQRINWSWTSKTGITAATAIRTAWAMLISSYCSSDDVVFGMTLNGRNAHVPGIEKMTGPTITTVPVRIRLDPRMTLLQLLEKVQQQAFDMIPYEQIGLQDIAKFSHDTQTACRFSSLLLVHPPTSQDDSNSSSIIGTPEDEIDTYDNVQTYPLTVACETLPDAIMVTVNYDGRVLDSKQAHRVLMQMDHVLATLQAADLTREVGTIERLGPHDFADIQTWNDKLPEPANISIPELIRMQTLEQPSAQAICSWDGNLTYKELDDLSSYLALHLNSLGVSSGVMVPLYFEKSKWAVVAMLGVLKAGGAYVQMDPTHPLDRCLEITRTVSASLVLTCPSLQSTWSAFEELTTIVPESLFADGQQFLTLNDSGSSKGSRATTADIALSSLALVVFTSGSTGKPKGVLISHRALASSILAHAPKLGYKKTTRMLQFAAHSFDTSNSNTLSSLAFGGVACIPSEHDRLNDLSGCISRLEANQAHLTASVASSLDPQKVPSLTNLILGGEAVKRHDVERWPDGTVRGAYGPSECVVTCVVNNTLSRDNATTIGRGVGCICWIVHPDNHDILLPIGGEGELLIEGPGLAQGYLNNPKKTNEVFVENPAWTTRALSGVAMDYPRRRFYKTGDLVRYNSDGSMVFVGRKDTQIKLRGQRIEIGEIEVHLRQALSQYDTMVDVVIIQHHGGEKILAAFIVLPTRATGQGLISTLDEHTIALLGEARAVAVPKLSRTLPGFMVPTLFVPLQCIPLTTSGKTDRRRIKAAAEQLPEEDFDKLFGTAEIKQAPRNSTEETMRVLWADVLRMDKNTIGINDHFIGLGGDSVSAMRLVAAARQAGLFLNVVDILRSMDLQQLSEVAKTALTTPNGRKNAKDISKDLSPHLRRSLADLPMTMTLDSNIECVIPCTDFQSLAYRLSQKKSRGFVSYFTFKLPTGVSRSRLRSACEQLVDHHSALRTVFTIADRQVWQVVLKSMKPDISIFDNVHDIEKEISELMREEEVSITCPTEVPVRFVAIESRGQQVLAMRISHAQYDGLCRPRIMKNLDALFYDKPISPEVPLYAFNTALGNTDFSSSLDYWRKRLCNSEVTYLADPNRHHHLDQGQVISTDFLTPNIKTTGVTFSTILVSAWAVVLSQLTGTRDVVFGQLVSGRSLDFADINSVIGACLNLVPIRAKIRDSASQALRDIDTDKIDSMEHEHLGFQQIIDQCTQWPSRTYFGSIVQHQNLGQNNDTGTTPFGMEIFNANTTDVWIFTIPKGKHTELVFSFSENVIPFQSAKLIIEGLKQTILYIAADVHNNEPIPQFVSEATLDAVSSKIISNPISAPKCLMQGLTTDIVRVAWESLAAELLWDTPIANDTSMFKIWDSELVAIQLKAIFYRLGVKFHVDDLLERPTFGEQMMLTII